MCHEAHVTNMKQNHVLEDLGSAQEQPLFYKKQLRTSTGDFQS